MLRKLFFLAGLPILMFTSCTPKVKENKVTLMEKKVIEAANQTNTGKASGPIALSHRKLEIKEIAAHLSLDEKSTIDHLKSTNTQGYYSLLAKNYPPGTEFMLYQIDLARNVY